MMTEKFKSIIQKAKEKKYLRSALLGIAGLLLAAGFWGIAFPRYMFTGDSVKIYDETGKDITEEAVENRNLYVEIGSAEPEQIELKLSILERLGNK